MARTSRRALDGGGEGDDLSTITGHSATFIGDVYEEDYPREAAGGAPQHLGRSGERPAAIAGRQDGRRADAETVGTDHDPEGMGSYEGAKGRENVSVQGDTPRQTGSISRYDATIANSTSGRECVASDGVGGNGDIRQPATGGGVEVVDDGDAPLPFHHRGTGSNAPAPRHVSGRPEIIHEDGPPMHHSEIEAAADDKSKPAKERGVEIIEDEEPAPNFCPPNNAGDEVAAARTAGKDPMDNAYLFMRYLLWVLTGIPPPSEDAESGSVASPADEDRRPAAIPARLTQQSPEEDTAGSSMQPQHHVLEARLVDEETPEFLVTYAYQPTQPTDTTTSAPVYDAYPVNEGDDESESKEEDETAPIPCWKRYERSACFVRALLLCILAVSLAVGLTVNRQTPDSELEQAQANPQSTTNPAAPEVMACVCSLAQDDFNGSQLQLQGSHRCQDDGSLTYEQAQRAPSFSMCVYPSADDAAGGFRIEEVSMRHLESNALWDANLTESLGIDESYLFLGDSGNATVKTMVLAPLSPITEIFSAISTPASFGGTLEVAGGVSFDVEQGVIPEPQTRQLTTADTATFQLSIDLLRSSTNNPGNGPTKTPSLQPVATDPTANPTFPFLLSNPPSNSPSSSPSADADPTAPDSCTNTIGFVDIYGDGCGYYEADANYPLFCASYGANGPAGNTPNEHCCVCKEALEAQQPTGTIVTPKPGGEPTKEPSSKPTTPLTPLPSREPSAQPTKQFILLGGTTSPSARPTGEPSNRPTDQPTKAPSSEPTARPSARPSREPTNQPTKAPSRKPTEPIAPSPTLPGQPTSFPSARPTSKPTEQPTKSPSSKPTPPPTQNPTREPSDQPTKEPSSKPTVSPSARPTSKPTDQPTKQPIDANPPTSPSQKPTDVPTPAPSKKPTNIPTQSPSPAPTKKPSESPTPAPSKKPTDSPTRIPTQKPTNMPTQKPTQRPTDIPTRSPSKKPTAIPTQSPSPAPTKRPTDSPTRKPTQKPTDNPSFAPSKKPTDNPTVKPTQQPTKQPTKQPTNEPTADPLQQLVFDETIVAHLSNENVAISGDTAVVGALLNGVGGKAFVFVKVGGAWMQQQTLEAPFQAPTDNFGRSVDIDGDYIVVGAPGVGANVGEAHVFFRSGNNWSWQQKLVPPGAPSGCVPLVSCIAVPGDFFGYSVAISGGTIIVGAEGRDVEPTVAADDAGAAYVYDRGFGPDTWSQSEELRHPTLQSGANFGRVDIDGDWAIVGAYRDVVNGPNSGSAHVFVRSAGIWTHHSTLEDPLGAANDWFGSIVSIHDGRAVVGAHISDENGLQDAGSIHVFDLVGDTWSYSISINDGICRPTGTDASDYFGYGAAVHGSQVVAGAPFDDDGGAESGSVRRFDWGAGAPNVCFATLKTLTGAAPNDAFGMSVAVDSGAVIIGSRNSAYVLSSL